jgi:hypothetical protein
MHEILPPWLAEAYLRVFERAPATNEPGEPRVQSDSRHERRFYEACVVRYDSDKLLTIVRTH